MKNIIFLKQNPHSMGGAQKYLARLSANLKKRGILTKILPFYGNEKFPSWLKALLYDKEVKKAKKQNEFYFSFERVSECDIYRAGDGVHKEYIKNKKFWFLNPLNFVYPNLEEKCFNNSKKIIANSNFIKKQIIKNYNIDENKIEVIYNGINLPLKIEKAKAKLEVCEKYGLDIELPIILFVGNGFKRKGVSDFLKIVSRLKNSVNSLIVGSDKRIDKFINEAKNLELNTKFIGEIPRVDLVYEASDIFLFPTTYEPFSNALLEAMSYGCVPITTAQNGASEIIDPKFIMSSHKNYEISFMIDEILKDLDSYQKKMIEISKKYSIEENTNKTLEVINEFIN